MSTLTIGAADPAPAIEGTLSFLVGQDGDGRWVAVEIHGLGGGIFRSRESAVHYARDESRGRSGAVRLVAEPLTLRIACGDMVVRGSGAALPTPSRGDGIDGTAFARAS